MLKNKYVQNPDLNYVSLESGASFSDVSSSVYAFPFMSEKRMTVIREYYPDKAQLKGDLKDFLENPPTDSILVIINDKPCEALKKYQTVQCVSCGKADVSTIVKWIKAESSKQGVVIDGERAQLIAEYCLLDMSRIENEVNKLCAYVGEGNTITKEAIEELVYKDAEYKIYEMTDYIGKRDFSKAVTVLTEMLNKGEPAQKLLISVYNYFRRLLHVAISDKPNGELASLLGIKEFAVAKAKQQAKMFSPKSLKKAMDLLIDADYDAKNGKSDDYSGLWLAVFKIMTE